MSARDRLAALFDPGTFQELGMHVRHDARHFGLGPVVLELLLRRAWR
jgi:acetyl-CoA carboxylase carboxyltransferase component